MRALHYLNQFFAGLGGEEAAVLGPQLMASAVGPGRGFPFEIQATIVCGDDFFAEHEPEALSQLLAWVEEHDPDVLLCGPAFGSGRYGYACGTLAREATRLGRAAICGMDPENPGVAAAAGIAYVVPTTATVAGMRDALAGMAEIASAVTAGQVPDANLHLARSVRGNRRAEATSSRRSIDLLLAKLNGSISSEVPPPRTANFTPPRPIANLANAVIALGTEAACVPRGNPDLLPSRTATAWYRYSVAGLSSLSAEDFESVHGGFNLEAANQDPNRLVPLDALRYHEQTGRIGQLHPWYYSTTGNGTTVAVATSMGESLANTLHEEGVDGVILTGT
jgi:glycine reductase